MSGYFRISTNSNQLVRIPLRGSAFYLVAAGPHARARLDAYRALSGPYKAGQKLHYEQLEKTRLAQLTAQQSAQQDTMTPPLARVLFPALSPSTAVGHAATPLLSHPTNQPTHGPIPLGQGLIRHCATCQCHTQCLSGPSNLGRSTSEVFNCLSMRPYQVDSLVSHDTFSWLGGPAATYSTDQPIVSASPHNNNGATATLEIPGRGPVLQSNTSPSSAVTSATSGQGPVTHSTVADRANKKRGHDALDVDECEPVEPRSPPKRACLARPRSAPPSLSSQQHHPRVGLQALVQRDESPLPDYESPTPSPPPPPRSPSPYIPKSPCCYTFDPLCSTETCFYPRSWQ
ncbi:hypothetical protein BC831DRAFT_468145 [Entophlyctis helioformis]|nr:hypothetical protein BC831DRAFT_468145 [Entophlyctis helioformis]